MTKPLTKESAELIIRDYEKIQSPEIKASCQKEYDAAKLFMAEYKNRLKPGNFVECRDTNSQRWTFLLFDFYDDDETRPFRAGGEFAWKQCRKALTVPRVLVDWTKDDIKQHGGNKPEGIPDDAKIIWFNDDDTRRVITRCSSTNWARSGRYLIWPED